MDGRKKRLGYSLRFYLQRTRSKAFHDSPLPFHPPGFFIYMPISKNPVQSGNTREGTQNPEISRPSMTPVDQGWGINSIHLNPLRGPLYRPVSRSLWGGVILDTSLLAIYHAFISLGPVPWPTSGGSCRNVFVHSAARRNSTVYLTESASSKSPSSTRV